MTKIEWVKNSDGSQGKTWNPIRAQNKATGKLGWHCEHVSEGCRHCYAESINRRLGTQLDFKPGHREMIDIFLDEKMLLAPLRWKRPRMIFVCSMTDLFGPWVTDEMLDRIFAIMAMCPQHTFQCLTKRPARMRNYMESRSRPGPDGDDAPAADIRVVMTAEHAPSGKWAQQIVWPLPNLWCGVSAEDQATADARIPDLFATPATVRWVSAEPLLGAIDFETAWLSENALDSECWGECAWCENGHPPLHNCQRGKGDWEKGRSGLDWIVVGGESGPGARPLHPDWGRSIRDQCHAAGVPFFFKQWGDWLPYRQWRSAESAGNALWRKDWMLLSADGVLDMPDDRWPDDDRCECAVLRVGKARAGRLLDYVEHNAMPKVKTHG